jgi:hypothetical protein
MHHSSLLNNLTIQQGQGFFCSPLQSDLAVGPSPPPTQLVPRALLRGAEHPVLSLTFSVEIKDTWFYVSTPPIFLHGLVLN